MLHNRSTLLTAGLIAVGYFLFTRLKSEDKKEVIEHIEHTSKDLLKEYL